MDAIAVPAEKAAQREALLAQLETGSVFLAVPPRVPVNSSIRLNIVLTGTSIAGLRARLVLVCEGGVALTVEDASAVMRGLRDHPTTTPPRPQTSSHVVWRSSRSTRPSSRAARTGSSGAASGPIRSTRSVAVRGGVPSPPRSSAAQGGSRSEAPAPRAVPRAVLPPGPSPTAPLATNELILGRLRSASAQDWFAVLGVHWSAYPAMIKEAFQREEARLRIARADAKLAARFGSDLDFLDRAQQKALVALSTAKGRREHRERLVNKLQRDSALGLYLNQGEMALMRNDHEAAVEAFSRVLELAPHHRHAAMRMAGVKEHHAG